MTTKTKLYRVNGHNNVVSPVTIPEAFRPHGHNNPLWAVVTSGYNTQLHTIFGYYILTVKNNATAQRFEAQVGDHLAVIQYQRQGNRITFIHTEVPHPLEGQGVGSRLAHFALEYAKAQQLEVVPLCPFVRGYIKRHPEYQFLVSQPVSLWGVEQQAILR